MNNTKQGESCENIRTMMEEIDLQREICTQMYCLEHDLDYDDASDYAKASIAVSEYQAPFTLEELALIDKLGDSSDYASPEDWLKVASRKVKKLADIYSEKTKDLPIDPEELKKNNTERSREMRLLSELIHRIRSANRLYNACISGGGKKETCNDEAIKAVRSAINTFCDKSNNAKIKQNMRILINFRSFELLKKEIRNFVRTYYPYARPLLSLL